MVSQYPLLTFKELIFFRLKLNPNQNRYIQWKCQNYTKRIFLPLSKYFYFYFKIPFLFYIPCRPFLFFEFTARLLRFYYGFLLWLSQFSFSFLFLWHLIFIIINFYLQCHSFILLSFPSDCRYNLKLLLLSTDVYLSNNRIESRLVLFCFVCNLTFIWTILTHYFYLLKYLDFFMTLESVSWHSFV